MRNAMLINEKDNVIVAIGTAFERNESGVSGEWKIRGGKSAGGYSYVSQNCQSSDKSQKQNY